MLLTGKDDGATEAAAVTSAALDHERGERAGLAGCIRERTKYDQAFGMARKRPTSVSMRDHFARRVRKKEKQEVYRTWLMGLESSECPFLPTCDHSDAAYA